ncbi:MAG: S8 family serine peptidase [Bacteriovoracia bacterium]
MAKGISKKLLGLFASAALLAGVGAGSFHEAAATTDLYAEHVPGEIIVKLHDGQGLMAARSVVTASLARTLGEQAVLDVRASRTDASMHTVKIASDGQLAKAIAALQADSAVAYAEPNYIYRTTDLSAQAMPNDADFGKCWGLNNTGQEDPKGQKGKAGSDIQVAKLWDAGVTGSKKVVVAVIDTGIDWTHPDLEANLYTNPNEIPDNGKDDDGNGFIDDVHGWNFAGDNANSSDDHDHGSHCAGTIGAVGDNKIGVAGVNWNVSLMPIKFLAANGSGTTEDAVDSINYATLMKVNVMSNSWGGGGASKALEDAIKAAEKAGILFVAAAGNNAGDNDARPHYPSNYKVDNVLSVAALDNLDVLAKFSNYGKTTVHVAAPGVNVYSTTKGGKYASFSGTSMATPHVAGAAALMLSVHPEWTYGELKTRLIKSSEPIAGLKNKLVAEGRISTDNAMKGFYPPKDGPKPDEWQDVELNYETAHPYELNQTLEYVITQPGAKYVRVIFSKIDTEAEYDPVTIETAEGQIVETISGSHTDYVSEHVAGENLRIRLTSDYSVVGWGYAIAKVQIIK